jgi:subtilisin family serine protease
MPRPVRANRMIVTALVLACSSLAARAGSSDPISVDPALRDIHPGEARSERFLSRDRSGGVLVDLFIEGDVTPETLRHQGIEVNAHAGRFLTARCPMPLLARLLGTAGIDRVTVASHCKLDLDRSALDVRANLVRTVTPPNFTGQTGAGVLVGTVDTGIDTSNPDFQHADGTTRIVSIWDQTGAGTPPVGFSYGTEWTKAQIDAGTASEVDSEGHGTHVMGIAAGNGRATGNGEDPFQYVGIAPEADLCVVKTTLQSNAIVDGVSYIFQKAASLGKRAVVNLSLGTQEGAHDGSLPMDQMLSALAGPGKVLVASAGNEGDSGLHGQLTLSGSTSDNMTLVVPAYTPAIGTGNDFFILSGWYSSRSRITLTITTPSGAKVGPLTTGQNLNGQNTQDGFVDVHNGTTSSSNGTLEIFVQVYDGIATRPPGTGTWVFTFTPVLLQGGGRVDTYLYESSLGDGSAPPPSWNLGLFSGGVISSPGSADSTVTVGAHATKDCWESVDGFRHCWDPLPTIGAIAPFSSQGPRRDGLLKPDLTAPGLGITSSLSAEYVDAAPLVVATDGVHVNFAGTSVSAPHVTGATALLLARSEWAGAGPLAIRGHLQATSRADAFTGPVPNWTWGAGKLDLAMTLPPPVVVVRPSKGFLYAAGRYDSLTVSLAGFPSDSISFWLSKDGGATYPFALGTVYGGFPVGGSATLPFFVDASMMTTQGKIRAVSRTGASTLTGLNDSLFTVGVPAGVDVDPISTPARFALWPNAPNPFNPVTTIRFGLDRTGAFTLRVYDVRGTLVRSLAETTLPAGQYHAVWDGKDRAGRPVGSGVYIYRLDQSDRHLARKMSLLR